VYRHTQRSTALLLLLLLAAVVPLALLLFGPGPVLPAGPRLTLVAAMVAVAASAVVFSSLTIEVADGRLSWHFGPGVLRKSVPVAAIASAEPTTTRLWEGWGIHLTTRGWLYNVSGRGAVIVTRRDGGRFMLGSDEPEALAGAIRAARGAAA
jgi:hypothetical protein